MFVLSSSIKIIAREDFWAVCNAQIADAYLNPELVCNCSWRVETLLFPCLYWA